MIYHSNTQKLPQRETSRLGRREAQGASGGEEAKEMSLNFCSPKGPHQFPDRPLSLLPPHFQMCQSLLTYLERGRCSECFLTQSPKWCCEKLLPEVGLYLKPHPVKGSNSFTAPERMAGGWPQNQIRHLMWDKSKETWHGSKNSARLCLHAGGHLAVTQTLRRTERLSWYLDFKLV